MESVLSEVEVRILGALIEKELATPDYYPLTLNSLVNACNQKSNRDPVLQLDDAVVVRHIEKLRDQNLAFEVRKVDSRVPKYEHNLRKAFQLTEQELAVLSVLLLRGPQTVGEIKGRTHRLYPFEGLDEVSIALETLSAGELPKVTCLPVQPGRKEPRFAHLFAGEPELPVYEERVVNLSPTLEPELKLRVIQLEEQVANLKEHMAEIQEAFEQFRQQFE